MLLLIQCAQVGL